MRRILVFSVLLLAACAGKPALARPPVAPSAPPQPIIETPLPATIPQSETNDHVLAQGVYTPVATKIPRRVSAQGLSMELIGLDKRAEGDAFYLVAHVCSQIPAVDWQIQQARLLTSSGAIAMEMLSATRIEQRQGHYWRCDLLYFPWPKERKTLNVKRVEIVSLEQSVPEQPDCNALNTVLAVQGIEVQAVSQEGVGGCEVVRKPDNMSMDEAYQRVQKALTHTIAGPWVFDVSNQTFRLP